MDEKNILYHFMMFYFINVPIKNYMYYTLATYELLIMTSLAEDRITTNVKFHSDLE